MKFFITGETFKTVGEKIRINIIQIDPKINDLLNKKSYGEGVSFWGHICICNPSVVYESGFFKEIKKYTKSKTEVELRLKVDYMSMMTANKKEAFMLICESILSGVDIAEKELSIEHFDFNAFRKDLKSLFKQKGWI